MPRWKKGVSGNPAGRKKGVPDRRTAARELFASHRNDLIAKAISMALAGDVAALRMCLDRVVPPVKAESAPVTLPALSTSLAGKGEVVLAELAVGAITPDEAATILGAIESQVRIIAICDLESRVRTLEEASDAAKTN